MFFLVVKFSPWQREILPFKYIRNESDIFQSGKIIGNWILWAGYTRYDDDDDDDDDDDSSNHGYFFW